MRNCAPLLGLGLIVCLTSAAPGQVISFSPLLHYDFDSESVGVLTDASGNGNDGFLEGAASLTPDAAGHPHNQTGSAANLAAAGDFVSVSTAATGAFDTLTANDQATIMFWVNGNEEAQPQNNWTFWVGPDRQLGSHAPWGNGDLFFDVAGCCGGNQRINRAMAPADYEGQWNHLAYVKDGPVTTVYINGEVFHSSHPYTDRGGVQQGGQGGDKLPLGAITEFHLGADAAGGSNHIGLFDDLAVYDQAVPGGIIASIADGGSLTVEFLRGDFNGDSVINVDDFNILATNLGGHLVGTVGHSQGDINFSQTVDLFDFREFKAAFPGVVALATGVPEPASIVSAILAIGAILPLLRARRSKRI